MTRDSAIPSDELAAVLDVIIPQSDDGRLPGAGEAGMSARIEELIRQTPGLGEMIRSGLDALEAAARERGGASFLALAPADRMAALEAIQTSEPAFVPTLVFHTFAHYYQAGAVVEGLGLEDRPPYPLGYEVEAGDLSLLDPVRARLRIYRDV